MEAVEYDDRTARPQPALTALAERHATAPRPRDHRRGRGRVPDVRGRRRRSVPVNRAVGLGVSCEGFIEVERRPRLCTRWVSSRPLQVVRYE